MEATEPTDRAEQNDSADPTDAADSADPKERQDSTDPAERDDRYPTTPPTYRSGDRRVDALGLPGARGPRLPEADLAHAELDGFDTGHAALEPSSPRWPGSRGDHSSTCRAGDDGCVPGVDPGGDEVRLTDVAGGSAVDGLVLAVVSER
jgi:hypothetical protein